MKILTLIFAIKALLEKRTGNAFIMVFGLMYNMALLRSVVCSQRFSRTPLMVVCGWAGKATVDVV